MTKVIHCNTSGVVVDIPTLQDDTGVLISGSLTPERVAFVCADTQIGGFTVRWQGRTARSVFPAWPGSFEGGLLNPPLPTLVYGPTSSPFLRIEDGQFRNNEGRWIWAGATDMNLSSRWLRGEHITPIIEQRKRAGAILLRVLAMGWPFVPHSGNPYAFPHYWDETRGVPGLWARLADEGLYCEWVIFAGTRFNLTTLSEQLDFFVETTEHLQQHPNMLAELSNEWNHHTQRHDPHLFSRPSTTTLFSHGSGGTDAPPVTPLWDYGTYHARRDTDNARGFTNYDAFEFQADYPKSCPLIPEESAKPENYQFNPDFAYRMGQHCGINWGGTFHSGAGVRSLLWSDQEYQCAQAFYRGLRDAAHRQE